MKNERPDDSERHLPSKLAIGLGIAALVGYEVLAPQDELISDQVSRIRKGKLGNVIVQALVWTMAGHLSGVVPKEWDIWSS